MAQPTAQTVRSPVDPVTFEVLRNAFINVCNEMASTLCKAAFTPVITEGYDFSATIHTNEGFLVACGERDLPGLLGTMESTLAAVLRDFPPEELSPGDVIIANIPHDGGSHLNDVRAAMPVFVDGALVALVANVGHWTDVGGSSPGSINLLATECYAEGLNISPVRIVRQGAVIKDVFKLVLSNIRLPAETAGDIHAQIRSLEVGEARLQLFFKKYGASTVLSAFEAMFDYSESILLKQIQALADGTYHFEDRMDEDPLDPKHRPVVVRLAFSKTSTSLTFDFTESDPDPRSALGCPRPYTCSATQVAFLNLFPGIAFNHGVVRNLNIVTRPGSVTHALFPSSVSGAASGAFEKVMGCVYGAVGRADPGRAVGGTCNLNNIIFGGSDPRFHRPYIAYIWNEGGYGGSPRGDGGNTPMIYPYASASRNQPVEVHERWYPIRYDSLHINYQSCGPGRFRGGPGIVRRFTLTHGDAVLTVWGDRGLFPPWGIEGGEPGGKHMVWLNPGSENGRDLGMYVAGQALTRGDCVELFSGGGGGYGIPRERDPERVLVDVCEGIIDETSAAAVYAVKLICTDRIGHHYEIDWPGTDQLRAKN